MAAKAKTKPDLKVVDTDKDSVPSHDVEKRYKPTKEEQIAIRATEVRRSVVAPVPHVKITTPTEGGPIELGVSDSDPTGRVSESLFMELFKTNSSEASQLLLTNMTNMAVKTGGDDASKSAHLNQMLATVSGIAPRDNLEAMLSVQMIAIHNATIKAATQLQSAKLVEQAESAEKQLNKLARTFTAQVEALKKYRTAGKQKIEVKHVTVKDGGQAIVGDVNTGGTGQ